MLTICRDGTTRWVALTRRFAFKFARFDFGWRNGLYGLLANLQENEFGRLGWYEYCPVLWCCPGGFVVVMPRAQPLEPAAWRSFDFDGFFKGRGVCLAEKKRSSFGIYQGRIVAIDYGS